MQFIRENKDRSQEGDTRDAMLQREATDGR